MEYIEGQEYILKVRATRHSNFFIVPGDMCTMIEETCVIDAESAGVK